MVAKKPVKKTSAPKAKAAKKATPKKVTPKNATTPKPKTTPKASPAPAKKTTPKASSAKKAKSPAAAKAKSPAAPKAVAGGGAAKLTILHTKECGCFGVRATRLINAMKAVNPNLAFSINPERAPKGSFELKTDGGKTLWKMEGLKRPFPTFKAVDFETLGAKLAKEI